MSDRAEQRRGARETSRRDTIAEQGLASLVRKLIAGEFTIGFRKVIMALEELNGGDETPPIAIIIGRNNEKAGSLNYATPFSVAQLKDDKDLALALALSLRGYLAYEDRVIEELTKHADIAGNGHGKIILTDTEG